jgi:hypothetical protein
MYFIGEWYADNYIMTDILDQIEFYSGTERKKMLKVPKGVGGSMLFGTTWRGYLSPTKMRTKDEETGLYRTKVYDDHPYLKDVFKEFSNLYFPNFEYSQVQMNKNFPCPPHKDKKNQGVSHLCCFGDFTGGDTCIEYEDRIDKISSKNGVISFNGSKYTHWVEPYEGTRYSLVFFTNRKKK